MCASSKERCGRQSADLPGSLVSFLQEFRTNLVFSVEADMPGTTSENRLMFLSNEDKKKPPHLEEGTRSVAGMPVRGQKDSVYDPSRHMAYGQPYKDSWCQNIADAAKCTQCHTKMAPE